MRLDYVLYGLGIVFLALSAVFYVLVSESDGQLLFTLLSAVLGVLSIGVGVFQRPHMTAPVSVASPVVKPAPVEAPAEPAPVAPASQPVTESIKQPSEPAPEAAVVAEVPVVVPTVVEAPKTEVAIEAAPVAPVTPEVAPVEPIKPEEPAPVEPVAQVAPPAQAPTAEISAPTPETEPSQAAPAVAESVFAQIRGINEKRAEQLKANGINSLQDLANASADELAAKVGVSPKIVKMWIGQAKKKA
jgi:predicted flap endonuclease-1-like 5' DNA nuclease